MKVSFKDVEESSGFDLIPEGKYPCRCSKAFWDKTNNGDPMMRLYWEIIGEEQTGRMMFTNIPFSEKGMGHARFVMTRMGIKVEDDMDIEPPDFINKFCQLENEHVVSKGGKKKGELVDNVPFAGYEAIDVEFEAPDEEGETETEGPSTEKVVKETEKSELDF